MHYYKRNIGDYHKKAGRLSMLEHGSYTLLLDACYDRERFPTMEEAIEWTWARTDEEIAAVNFVLSKFFDLVDGVYVQQRIKDEFDHYQEKSLKNKEIAIAREAARKTKREQDVHESCTNRHLTTNQEPLTNIKDKSSCDQQAESRVPYSEIFDAYAELLPELPQLKVKDESRKRAIRSIWKMDAKFQTADFFKRYFAHVNKSDFLMGRDTTAWKGCSFDWLMKPANFKKIIEGNYHHA